MTLHFTNDVAKDTESTQKSIISSYSLVRKLINRIPGSDSLAMSTSVLEVLPGKLDIKRHSNSIYSLFPGGSSMFTVEAKSAGPALDFVRT